MKSWLIYCCLILSMTVSLSAFALVDPVEQDEEAGEWLAFIFLYNETLDFSYPLCQGALIDSQWILASRACFFDPYKIISRLMRRDDTEIYAVIGTSPREIRVADDYQYSSSRLALFRLEEAVDNDVLPIADIAPEALVGQDVSMFSIYASGSVKESVGNPEGDSEVSCTINGDTFVTSYAICYVIASPEYTGTLYQVTTTVIDPAGEDFPDGFYDQFTTVDTTGGRMYLALDADTGYACIEDAGAPILMKDGNGAYTMVGMVADVGPAAAHLTCNPSTGNYFMNVNTHREFIDRTIAGAEFDAVCPAQPALTLESREENEITLSWEKTANTEEYRLFLTQERGYKPLRALGMGKRDSFTTVLNSNSEYAIGLMGFNRQCNSPMSEILTISTFP